MQVTAYTVCQCGGIVKATAYTVCQCGGIVQVTAYTVCQCGGIVQVTAYTVCQCGGIVQVTAYTVCQCGGIVQVTAYTVCQCDGIVQVSSLLGPGSMRDEQTSQPKVCLDTCTPYDEDVLDSLLFALGRLKKVMTQMKLHRWMDQTLLEKLADSIDQVGCSV